MSISRSNSTRNAPLLPSPLGQERTSTGASRPSSRPVASHLPDILDPHPEHQQDHEQAVGLDDQQDVPPQLQPFFTLIEDASTQTTVHPSVTYIFSDDEHDPVTEAVLRTKSRLRSDPTNASQQRRKSQQSATKDPPPEPIERHILIALGPDGRSIQSAESLTADWHVDSAELTPAPTLDGDGAGSIIGISPGTLNSRLRRTSGTVSDRLRVEEERERLKAQQEDGLLMLQLHGHGQALGVGDEDAMKLGLDGLRDAFLERMEELRRVAAGPEGIEGQAVEMEGTLQGTTQVGKDCSGSEEAPIVFRATML